MGLIRLVVFCLVIVGIVGAAKGSGKEEKIAGSESIVDLDGNQFESFLKKNEDKRLLIEFYANWCSFCQKLGPTFVEVAEALKTNPNFITARIDCDADRNKPYCAQHDISTFPTIKLIQKVFFCKKSSEKLTSCLHFFSQTRANSSTWMEEIEQKKEF